MDYPLSKTTEYGLRDGKFTDGVPGLYPASVIPSLTFNGVIDEIKAVQAAAGVAADEANTTQLLQSILALLQKQVVLDDTGTANAYVAANSVPLKAATLSRGLEQRLVIANANTGASTYAPDGLAAKPIYGLAMQPLQGGELAAGGLATLSYSPTANSGSGAWILLRCTGGIQQGAAATQSNHLLTLGQASALATPVGQYGFFAFGTAPDGWLKANGAAIPVAGYAALAARLYCGDANNATALYGYRCTNPTTPSTTRSTTGAYIVLPDARAEFLRGWDDGRGVDASRLLWLWQAGQVLVHSHTASAAIDGNHQHTYVSGAQGSGYQTGGASPVRENAYTDLTTVSGAHSHTITVNSTGGAENLVRNLAALICIKY